MDQSDSENDPVENTRESDAVETAKPIHVALLVDDDFLGRFGCVFGHALVGLIDEAVTVTVVCPNPEAIASISTGPAEIVRFRASYWPGKHRRSVQSLTEVLQSAKVNLIHSACGSQGRLACELAGQMDRPYVVTVTGLLQSECFWPIDESRCRALIAISEPIRQMLLEVYDSMADRVHLVQPGCFCHDHSSAVGTERARTIVSAGPFDRQGGYDVLLRALSKVVAREIDVSAFLLGEGRFEFMLRRWTARANLSSRIVFLPPITNWESVLDEADLYIQPGPLYQLHAGPYEAIARGCPVFTTPDTAFDLVLDEQTGKIIPAGDDDAWAEALIYWLGNPQALAELSERTSRFAREKLSLHRATTKLIDLYRAALNYANG